uniref:BZIP domain-containing protein n=1 Tax=Amphora coffeiformis TaxID=265554 RepID=A0A7S3L468_9STRA|mmetsp:Transcript_800/g.1533  ORF Transcript_800/g.1533 Transcript_800/m.1533 type:complete len:454 (+) Transcript_800:131-1492(+)
MEAPCPNDSLLLPLVECPSIPQPSLQVEEHTDGENSFGFALKQLEECIDVISFEEKKDYLEARQVVPLVIERESNPARFLRVDSMNPWSAANRLIQYWKYRRAIFGERWLLPLLDLSGHGALTTSDVKDIEKDVIVSKICPGKAMVVYVDFARVPVQDSLFSSRAIFFVSAALQSAEWETKGVHVIKTLTPQFLLRRRNKKGRLWEIVRTALPMRVRKVFLLTLQSSRMSDGLIQTTANMASLVSEFFLGHSPTCIFESKKEDAYIKLISCGVPPVCIPYFLGGEWDMQGVPYLQGSPLQSLLGPTQRSARSSVFSQEESGATKPKRKRGRPPKVLVKESTEDLKVEGDEDFSKKRNALYSRRLYRKRKEKYDELQQSQEKLNLENDRLRKENEWLEGLIVDAKLQVVFEDDDIFVRSSLYHSSATTTSYSSHAVPLPSLPEQDISSTLYSNY